MGGVAPPTAQKRPPMNTSGRPPAIPTAGAWIRVDELGARCAAARASRRRSRGAARLRSPGRRTPRRRSSPRSRRCRWGCPARRRRSGCRSAARGGEEGGESEGARVLCRRAKGGIVTFAFSAPSQRAE